MRRSCTLAVTALLWTLATTPLAAQQDDGDPLEPINRAIFGFNRVVDGLILDPLATGYGAFVPDLAKTGIRNFLDNLRSPVVFVNDLLQGNPDKAGVTLGRFLLNTIAGFGLFDVATEAGFEKHRSDFGQTLGVWGAGEGFYLVLPILGPSSLRDATGLGVDALVLDPLGYISPLTDAVPLEVRIGRTVVDGIDARWRLDGAIDDVFRNSLDPYATFRTVFRQRREADIQRGRAGRAGPTEYDAIFSEDLDE
jgi:phospholipid-binding lipoprotein MlaA